jgi:hypothetical protein
MKKMLSLIGLIFFCCSFAAGQKSTPQDPKTLATSELSRLRDQYVKSTHEYKASLQKLLALYEDAVKKAEQKRDQAQKLFADGLMGPRDVERTEIAVRSAELKVSEVQQQIKTADTQIAQALVDFETRRQNPAPVIREYRRAVARQPACRDWTLTAPHSLRPSDLGGGKVEPSEPDRAVSSSSSHDQISGGGRTWTWTCKKR